MTTNTYIRYVKTKGWQPFDKRLFQRSFYEHIVRDDDDDELNKIREYVQLNPKMWDKDKYNKFKVLSFRQL